MPYLNRTTGTLHRRWKCVRWNARQHGHDVEEIDAEDVPGLEGVGLCGNCLSPWHARRIYDWEGEAA